MKNKIIISALAVFAFVLILAGVLSGSGDNSQVAGKNVAEPKTELDAKAQVLVYKAPTCGCCGAFVSYLKGVDYAVTVREEMDMNAIKEQYGVPMELQSCHTSIIDGYVVEGHMPEAVIAKLLEEKPDIAGIALPGMPSGSPGMPGPKAGPFTIYSFTADGQVGEFMSL